MKKGASWDRAKAKELYEQDVEYKVIALRVGATVNSIKGIARRNGWRKRDYSITVKWDFETARKLRELGMSYERIAQCVGTTKNSVISFADRHWKDKPFSVKEIVQGPVKRYARGERTLPKLPSIADLYPD